jgi:TrmH family RNA methyltransferase
MPDDSDIPARLEAMSRVRVVLVRPQVAGNIGSVARVMENLGAGPLYLVEPQADHLSRESVARSTRGEHRLHEARTAPTIGDALDNTIFAIGASRRRGPTHQTEDLLPAKMAETVRAKLVEAEGDVALVFGTEDNGLSREDLLACDLVVQIPGHPDYPTFNLAHAAVICLYEVFVAVVGEELPSPPDGPRSEPADLAMMDRLMSKLQHALLTIGYLRAEKPDHLMFPIRAILSRAKLTRAEAQILMGLAQQIDEFARYEKGDENE